MSLNHLLKHNFGGRNENLSNKSTKVEATEKPFPYWQLYWSGANVLIFPPNSELIFCPPNQYYFCNARRGCVIIPNKFQTSETCKRTQSWNPNYVNNNHLTPTSVKHEQLQKWVFLSPQLRLRFGLPPVYRLMNTFRHYFIIPA